MECFLSMSSARFLTIFLSPYFTLKLFLVNDIKIYQVLSINLTVRCFRRENLPRLATKWKWIP